MIPQIDVNQIANRELIARLERDAAIEPTQVQALAKVLFQEMQQNRNVDPRQILQSAKAPVDLTNMGTDEGTPTLFFQALLGNLPTFEEIRENPELVKAMFLKKNPEALAQARGVIQQALTMLGQVSIDGMDEGQRFRLEVMVGDLLCLYPFLDPAQGEELKVPVYINDQWVIVDYQVERIVMTPKFLGSPMVAYGLTSQNPAAPPLLLFKGTTYPTDEGFGLSLLADINPLAAVGAYPFLMGKEELQAWLNDKNGVVVYGKSLGAALARQAALHLPDHISKVMAFGGPGFYLGDKKIVENLGDRCPRILQIWQENDPVSLVDGTINARPIEHYKVVSKHEFGGFVTHALPFSLQNDAILIKSETLTAEKKWQRTALSITRFLASFVLFPLILLIHLIQTAVKGMISLIANGGH